MKKPSLMYFSAEGQTFYLDASDTELTSKTMHNLMLHCDYCFIQNRYQHWQFIKNRQNGDTISEYFELKDLLNEIPLHSQYQNRKALNKCKYIVSPTHAEEIIAGWHRERKNITRLTTPWYEQ